MTIVFSGSHVANVELSDSFNTWRIVTNKTLRDAASTSGNNVFLGTQSFSNTVTANAMTITTATLDLAIITQLQDLSNRTLTIRDEANNVVWGN